jgi:hypothetical protein
MKSAGTSIVRMSWKIEAELGREPNGLARSVPKEFCDPSFGHPTPPLIVYTTIYTFAPRKREPVPPTIGRSHRSGGVGRVGRLASSPKQPAESRLQAGLPAPQQMQNTSREAK